MDRVVAIVLFVAALGSYACITQSTRNPNVRTRMFLTVALVENRSIRIDDYIGYTLDRAKVDGRYYSEKAPGLSLAAVPAVATGRLLSRLRGARPPIFDPRNGPTPTFDRLTYFATFWTSGLFGALAVVALYVIALRLGATPGGAVFAAVVLGWATPLWGWATAFVGHAMASGCLALGLLGTLLAVDRRATPRARTLLAAATGVCLGWAPVVEFTTIGPVAAIVVFGAWRARRLPARRRLAVVGALALACGLTPLLVYDTAAFGAPWRLGYGFTEPWYPAMHEGVMGVRAPSMTVLLEILVGRYRGLGWISPVSLAALVALVALWCRRRWRAVTALATGVTLYYLLLNAAYAYWDGGWSTGPRHLTPMLPILSLSLAPIWSARRRLVRATLVVVAALSGVLSLVCVSTSMFAPSVPPAEYGDALGHVLLPAFEARLRGQQPPPPPIDVFARVAPWQLGAPRLVGLLLVASIPAVACLVIMVRVGRRQRSAGEGR